MKRHVGALVIIAILTNDSFAEEASIPKVTAGEPLGPSNNLAEPSDVSFVPGRRSNFETEALSNHCYWDSLMHVADDDRKFIV